MRVFQKQAYVSGRTQKSSGIHGSMYFWKLETNETETGDKVGNLDQNLQLGEPLLPLQQKTRYRLHKETEPDILVSGLLSRAEVWFHTENWRGTWRSIYWMLKAPFREGNGTPLQYSCLENPMDGGAWRAAVHGVAKSRTRLSNFTFTFLHWRRTWQPTPVFLPGEAQWWGSLVGCRLWDHTESDTTEVT